jgi:hypothetical protein
MRLHIHRKDGTPISLNWLDSDYSSLWEFSSYQPLCGWLLMMCFGVHPVLSNRLLQGYSQWTMQRAET